ncbi:hypothetical protein Scep_015198 [Stephania cephalantha]|uniref:Uncharacterized protein n=1 Tax=Stephania cephalantha TaxID=152367 RepID=A0AAP0P060_9MAGN
MANEIHLGPDELASTPCSPLMNVAKEQIVLVIIILHFKHLSNCEFSKLGRLP